MTSNRGESIFALFGGSSQTRVANIINLLEVNRAGLQGRHIRRNEPDVFEAPCRHGLELTDYISSLPTLSIRSPKFSMESMAVQSALEGQGIALASSALVADDLAAGRVRSN